MTMVRNRFDVVVIGGGHAGCEAAAASARFGARTLLVTHRRDTIGEMSCNPAIGGVGKGHLVREVDALDGLMARAADAAGIHFKVLNQSKGPAVRGPRAQADRAAYRAAIQALLARQDYLDIREGAADDIVLSASGGVTGLLLSDGDHISCGAVVITSGTFLNGKLFTGHLSHPGGRFGEAPSVCLAGALARASLPIGRLKTGTPPRLARDSIAWDALERDPGDRVPEPMSLMTQRIARQQVECRITWTTPETHDIVRSELHQSAAYSGAIVARGPRYCPSIEDKVVRFADRLRHQIFLEPEGIDSPLVYPNGISTNLPPDVQARIIATIPGLQNARIVRHGYAIEYDYVDPRSLHSTLAVKVVPGLFLAGQINGTTGYEEAAGQGILAGLNAARHAAGTPLVSLDRSDAYIGVMIDDLVTRGVSEPYRIFTSRAEYRLSLRADNADARLTPQGMKWGCIGMERQQAFRAYADSFEQARSRVDQERIPAALARSLIPTSGVDGCGLPLAAALAHPSLDDAALRRELRWMDALSPRVFARLRAESIYSGYLARQEQEIRAVKREYSASLLGVDFAIVTGLSSEIRERLSSARPASLGAASRLEGITPSALAAIIAHLRKTRGSFVHPECDSHAPV